MTNTVDYDRDFQLLMLSFMISDNQAFAQSQAIIKPEYFDDKLRNAARFILDYANEHNDLPTTLLVNANTKVDVPFNPDAAKQSKWYLENIEKFCRFRALESVIFAGSDLLEKGRGGELEGLVKEAMQISLIRDLGTSYFADPKTRLERLNDKSNIIATGWNALDKKLEGGFNKGSLNIFAGGSGSGKSLFLLNISRKWALSGMNVVYISLELSEDLINLRLDSMITNKGTPYVRTHIDDVTKLIRTIGLSKKTGDLHVKKLPEAGTTCNTIRAYLKEYEIQTGHKPDALIIDYLDLMHPNNAKIDVSALFTKDKYVSEEMRAIATDWGIPVVSASQLNRSSVDAQEFDHSHIAGGISKINTADNVFGILTSLSMRERGVYQLQFLKTRSAAATGMKIELYYNQLSMLIEDIPEEENADIKPMNTDEIRNSFKNNPTSTRIPVMERQEVKEGMSISEAATPQAGPMRANIAELMKNLRKNDE